MNAELQRAMSLIGPGATLRLPAARGHTVLNLRGRLWITQHGDARDIFLESGERFTIDRGGDTIVQALGNSAAVILLDPPADPARASGDEPAAARSLAAAIDRHAADLARARGRAQPAQLARNGVEPIERDARQLRAAALKHLGGRALRALMLGWDHLRRALSPGKTAGCAS